MNLTTSGQLVSEPRKIASAAGQTATIATLAVDLGDFVELIGLAAYGHQAAELARHRDDDLMSVSGPVQFRRHLDDHGNERATLRIVVSAFVPAVPPTSAA